MMHFKRFAETAILAALAYVPAALASQPVRDFLDKHPAYAAYLPIVTGLLAVVYKAAKDKWETKPAASAK